MKKIRPTWVKAIGIIGMIIGVGGIFQSAEDLFAPMIDKHQENAMQKFTENVENECVKSEISKMVEMSIEMTKMPPWFSIWKSIYAIINIPLSVVILISSIFLFQLNIKGIDYFLKSTKLLIALLTVEIIVSIVAGGLAGYKNAGEGVAFIVILMILIYFTNKGDKTLFEKPKQEIT